MNGEMGRCISGQLRLQLPQDRGIVAATVHQRRQLWPHHALGTAVPAAELCLVDVQIAQHRLGRVAAQFDAHLDRCAERLLAHQLGQRHFDRDGQLVHVVAQLG